MCNLWIGQDFSLLNSICIYVDYVYTKYSAAFKTKTIEVKFEKKRTSSNFNIFPKQKKRHLPASERKHVSRATCSKLLEISDKIKTWYHFFVSDDQNDEDALTLIRWCKVFSEIRNPIRSDR